MIRLSPLSLSWAVSTALFLSSCAVVHYPGQPGMVASSFVKIDLEVLEEPGLFVYEAVYNNTSTGGGTSAVVTKLYPGAKTYTTNVRTNADGTLFRVKGQYNGADVQMISIPHEGQAYVNPNHQLAFLIDYDSSLDEIDDKNVAEENIFNPDEGLGLRPLSFETKRMKWEMVKAAKFLPSGNLGYEITAIELGTQKYVPSESIALETSMAQNAIKTTLNSQIKTEFTQFFESHFPKGYRGKVNFYVKGTRNPLTLQMGINTFKTAEASGLKIIKGIPESILAAHQKG